MTCPIGRTSAFGLTSVLATTALLLASACSNESDPDTNLQALPAAESTEEATAMPAAAASIRLVNLWVDSGQPAAVDITVQPIMGEDSPLFVGVQPGMVTAAHGVPADVRLEVFRQGQSDTADEVGSLFLTENDIAPSNQLTLVLTWTRALGESERTAGMDVFYDTGDYITGTMPARPVDGGLLVAYVTPLNRVLADDRQTLTFGIPGQGCLRLAGSANPPGGASGITVSAGGTAAIAYDLPPGQHAVAAWPATSSRCEGEPLIGPVNVTIAAGRRSWLFGWSTGSSDMRLLAVEPHPGNS